MKTECNQFELRLQGPKRRKIIVRNDGEATSSDGGLLLLGEIENQRHFIRALVDCCIDHRNPELVTFKLEELLKQRIFGICQGYEDLNDHEDWRHDPLLGIVCYRTGDDGAMAGKSTLNRVELGVQGEAGDDRYHRIEWDEDAIRGMIVDAFISSFEEAPAEIILDFDATDDPVHGGQEGRFFNAFYDEYCFLPLYVFSGEHLLAATLRKADIDAASGSTPTLAFLVNRIRESWPGTRIIVRADSGFCRDDFLSWCEAHDVSYIIGLARNNRLVRRLSAAMGEAHREFVRTSHGSRVFKELRYRTRNSWSRTRRVVGKAEYLAKGPNPRFVVTNLDSALWPARELYEDLYCARGDMENRIKEQQLYLFADRTSCHPFRANQFRLWLSSIAYLFIVELRRVALKDTEFNHAQASTIRLKLFKVAVTVSISVRRVLLRVPRAFPYWSVWQRCSLAFSSA